MSEKKVLIIEDDDDDYYLLARQLRDARISGLNLTRSLSLKETLEVLDKEKFDLIISDLKLSDAEGFETIQALSFLDRTAIIVLTGRDDDSLLEKMSELGVHDYLVKGEISHNLLRRSILYSFKRVELDLEKKFFFESSLESEKMRTLGLMAGGISHDFNNKLAILSSDIDLAERCLEDREKVLSVLGGMRDVIQKASSLPQKLLAFSRTQSTESQVISLKESIEDSLDVFQRIVPKRIRFRFENGLKRKTQVRLGIGDLDQILTNLILNSCEAIKDKKGTITLELRTLKKNEVSIFVRDDGPGIPEDHIGFVFEPFFSTKRGYMASGMGLSIVKSTTVRNHGQIYVRNIPGGGAEFEVQLPVSSELG